MTFCTSSSASSRTRSVASAVGFWTKSIAPGVQRLQSQLSALAGDANDYHRQRPAGHLLLEKGHAVHTGHHQVKGDHIRMEALDHLQGFLAIVRAAHHFDEGTAG